MIEEPKKWLYAYRQTIRQDGVDKQFITLTPNYPSTLKEAELLGRVLLYEIEGERK